VIIAVVVLLVVVCGVIFATFVAFMIVNKIIKNHLHLLERQQVVVSEQVADLDDPHQQIQASNQIQEGFQPTLEKRPLLTDDSTSCKGAGMGVDKMQAFI